MTYQQRGNDRILDRVSQPEMTVMEWLKDRYGDQSVFDRPVPDQAGTEPDWRLEALEESMRLERPGGLP